MKRLIAIMVLGFLTACGVDGEPETPEAPPGIDISVEVQYGVSGSF